MTWSKVNVVALAGLEGVHRKDSLGGKNCALFGSVTEAGLTVFNCCTKNCCLARRAISSSIIIVQKTATQMHS